MANYIGFTPDDLFGAVKNRYFYGLRRTDQGELFLGKVDQLKNDDSIAINNTGTLENSFTNFEEGQDFTEGRDVNHELVYENLNYEQFIWNDKNIFFYVNDAGELVARINQSYTYDDNISSDGV